MMLFQRRCMILIAVLAKQYQLLYIHISLGGLALEVTADQPPLISTKSIQPRAARQARHA